MKNERARRLPFLTLLAIVLTVVFALSLIPLALAARYDAPDSDDLLYGTDTQLALAKTGSAGTLIASAANTTGHIYRVNHGRLANSFFGAAYLGAFGLGHYWTTPLLMLFALTAGTLFFTYVLLCRVLKTGKSAWLAVSMLMLILNVQLMPSPAEGLFWFCGGLGYTVYYALTLVLFALLLLVYQTDRNWVRVVCGCLSALTAAVVSLLCFTLMFLTAGLLAGYAVCAAVHKKRAALAFGIAALLLVAAGSIVQVTAPGVAYRAQWEQALYHTQGMGAARAVAESFIYAAGTLLYRLDSGMLLFIVLACAGCLSAVKACGYAFRLPGLVTAASFCLYATLFTTTLYAMSSIGPLRQRNLFYFAQFFFWGVNAVYWMGWALHRMKKLPWFAACDAQMTALMQFIAARRLALLAAVGTLLLAAALVRDVNNAASVAALRELTSGSAQSRYETRMEELAAGLGDTPGERAESRLYVY